MELKKHWCFNVIADHCLCNWQKMQISVSQGLKEQIKLIFIYLFIYFPPASPLLKCSFEGQKGQTFSMVWKLPQISPIFFLCSPTRLQPLQGPWGTKKAKHLYMVWDSVPPLLSSIIAPPQFSGGLLASPQAKPRRPPAVLHKIHQLSVISAQPYLIKKARDSFLYLYLLNTKIQSLAQKHDLKLYF